MMRIRWTLPAILLLLTLPAWAAQIQVIGPTKPLATGTTCDSCSGDLALAHHFEDATCDDNTKKVCGCSDNASKDLTLGTGGTINASISATTGTNWPSDGDYSLAVGTNDTTIPLTWDKTKGTISFDAYCTTFGARSYLISIGDSSDRMDIRVQGSDDGNKVAFYYRSTTDAIDRWAYTSNGAFTGAKASIVAKWDTTAAHDGHYMTIAVNGDTAGVQNTAIVALAGTYTTVKINNTPTTTNVCYIDNLKVYTSWQ